jgi:hypothetical protein
MMENLDQEKRKSKLFLSWILIFLLLLCHPQITSSCRTTSTMSQAILPLLFFNLGHATSENIIFEQIGSLAGSTSYLHAHITLSISSIEQQFNKYRQLVKTEYSNITRVHGMMKRLAQTKMLNQSTNPTHTYFSDAYIYGTAVVWTNMAKLHLEDMEDIQAHIESLRNLLPDIATKNQNQVSHDPSYFQDIVKRMTIDSYVEDDPPKNPMRRNQEPELDEADIPFHFRETPLHEAAYLITRRQSLSLNPVTSTPAPISTTTTPTLNQTEMDAKATNSTYTRNGRGKRMAGIIALPMAIAATAMGIYNSVQISFLKNELLEVKDNVKRLFEVVQRYDKELADIGQAIREIATALLMTAVADPSYFDARLTRIENQLRDRLRTATHALQTAQHRRLAIDYLSPRQIRLLYSRLVDRAAEFGCELILQHHSDLFQIEASLLFDGADAHLLIHVPMVPRQSLLRLFKLHPFPLPFFDDHFLIPDVQNDVLAVSSTDQRLSTHLSSVDLLGCHRMNQVFMCDRFGVLSKQFNSTCLGSLFNQDFSTARSICRFEIVPVAERVYQLKKNWFATFLPAPSTVPVKCRNGTVTDLHLPRGPSRIHLSPGCEATFSHHHVFADLSIKMPAETLHFDWEWDPLDLLHMPQTDIAQELQRLREFGIHRPVLTDLQYRSAEQQQGAWFSLSHILHYIGNFILILLILTLVIWIAYRCFIWRRSRRQNSSSNPQPRLQRANDPYIRAVSASRVLGTNNPYERQPPPRYPEQVGKDATAPREPGVRYHAVSGEVELPSEPYADSHLRVRSELERQNLAKGLQAQLHRLSQLPVVPDE